MVIAIVLLVAGKKMGWFGKEFTISVATEKVKSTTLTEFITANGKIQPETQVKISPDVSGEVIELYVEEGDEVIKGDLLYKTRNVCFGFEQGRGGIKFFKNQIGSNRSETN